MRTKNQIIQDYVTALEDLKVISDSTGMTNDYEEFNRKRMEYEKLSLKVQCLSQELDIITRITMLETQQALEVIVEDAVVS